jgi:NodT family efflux transporter outer membrane factor (OMF) lipoprotein
MKPENPQKICIYLISVCISGCTGGLLATVGPDYLTAILNTPSHWSETSKVDSLLTTSPHQGNPENLKKWWQGFQDPVLTQLLSAAQDVNTSVMDAKARIAQSRATLVGAEGALLPTLDFSGGGKRSSASFGGNPFVWNQLPAGLQSSWEIDLFGGLARQEEAAQSQLESRQAAWHDARVSVAAEVANAYVDYRYCELQVNTRQRDTASKMESARLSEIASQAGLKAISDIELLKASVAEGNHLLFQQQSQCKKAIQGLVAMTGLPEEKINLLLTGNPTQLGQLPTPPTFNIDAIPANVLLQRPDIASAERDVAEASAKIGVEQAKRFPKLSLSGNITPTLQNINGAAFFLAETWSFGPTLSLPLFDAGKRAADVELARVQYEAAENKFRSKVRTAVKEVEEALIRLNSVSQRLPEAQKSFLYFQRHFDAMQNLYLAGLGNLIDVETSRRNMLSAEMTIKEIEKERVSAWIALYRSAGGSWSDDNTQSKTTKPPSPHVDDNREKL